MAYHPGVPKGPHGIHCVFRRKQLSTWPDPKKNDQYRAHAPPWIFFVRFLTSPPDKIE